MTDTQADLAERARAFYKGLWITEGEERNVKKLVAFAQSEREAAAARNLFVPGEFAAHSGGTLSFKIDCDALSDADITTLAAEIARRFKFDAVYGVPRGGVRLADALAAYLDHRVDKTLIVDDVLTTGRSMEEAKARLGAHDPIGVVIFARGPCPPWITPLFATPEGCEAAAAEARRAAIEDAAKVCDGIREEYLAKPRRDPEHTYAAMAGYCAGAIRALASPPASDAQRAHQEGVEEEPNA